MVSLQIFRYLLVLIIVLNNIIQGYGYSLDMNTRKANDTREENTLNDAASNEAIEDSYNVKNRKGGRHIFKGGCARRPNAPVNGKIKCSLDSGCTASCAPDYKFPNGAFYLTITCVNKEWHIEETEWNLIPHCEPICIPECQNKGICIAPHHCDCPEHFTGPQCQFEDKPCLNYPPLVLNSYKKCNSKTCTVSCMKHFTFPDNSSVANLICKNGNWKPTRSDWVSIPDCEPVCEPPCQNGGNCLPTNLCQCPQDYRGSQCQYSADTCDAEKLRFNGGYYCTGDSEIYSCTLNCPAGVEFEFLPATTYTCTYDKGIFEPQPIPQCKVDNNIKIISLGTSYNTYVRESNHSWSMHDIFGNTKHSQKIHNGNYGIHGSNAPSYPVQSNGMMILEMSRPRPKTCFTWGGAHYKTFDDRIYSFDSNCPYTLLRETRDGICTIVVLNNPKCKTESSNRHCVKIIKLFLHDKEYTLTSDETGIPVFFNGKRFLPIPLYLPGLRVDKSAHFTIISLDSLGIKLKWDGALLLQIDASENIWNKTTGLCGTMNDDQNDEFLTKSGSYANSISALANSWRVEDLGETCDDYPNTRHACELKDQFARDAFEFCTELLSNHKFKTCANTIDFSELTEACLWDYCACEHDDRRKCACDTMDVYIRQCAHKGIAQLTAWRSNDTCPIFCDGGRLYLSCGPKVEASCFSGIEAKQEISSECEEGCFCPAGTLEHEGKCISPEECPCRLRGKLFQPGTSVQKKCNTCTCISGKWVCTQIRCGARCAIVGDPHYTTFDGKHYDFMGKCKYYLIKGENYTIESENVPCSGAISENLGFIPVNSPSCTKSVMINFKDTNIKLKQNHQITINGNEIIKFPMLFNDARIRIASSIFVVVQLPNALEVWWDGVSRVYINAPAEFHNRTKGLCGTFTENQKDDFITPDGDIETAAIAFANKWKITETNEYCIDELESKPKHPCDLNPQRRASAEEYCSKIHSDIFSDCHWYVDPLEFYRDCMYDMCACNTDIKLCFCPMLAAYAKDCAALGVKLLWRAEINECKIHCNGGQTYQICGNSCTRSCTDISFYRDCKQECVEGCNCPEDQTLDVNGECIPIIQCPCIYAGREYKPNYREVRPGNKGQEFCSCIGGIWECRLATSDEIREYPPVTNLLCPTSKHLKATDCEPVEQKTCNNMHVSTEQTPSVCTSGCVCKSGYVLDVVNGVCIKKEDCPCHHGGKSYKESSVIQDGCNTCTCKSTKWECTDRICAGICSVWGDSHYKTFDGKMYTFQGICDYVLAKSALSKEERFDISIQNVPCGTNGVACSKSIKLIIGSGEHQEELVLTKGKELPPKIYKRIAIRSVGLFVFVDVPDLGLVLQWDKGTRIYVRLNPEWKGHTMGLCGDYNDNAEDDFKTPSGGISEVSVNLFGDSWKKNSFCLEPKDMQDDACERHPERKLWSLRQCNVLKSSLFSPCHSEVEVESYLHDCIFDTCNCDTGGDCECLCTALAAYAHECNIRGVPVKWRTQDLCPLQCDEKCSTYSACVSTCPHETCDNLMTVKQWSHLCTEDTCVEGCQFESCPDDYVYRNANYTECISKSMCTKPFCVEIDGTTYYEGDRVSGDDCHSCFCSRGRVTCNGEACTSTTRANIATVPLAEPQKCIDGWSMWINKDPAIKGKKFLDVEPLPRLMDFANVNGFAICDREQMVDIRCRSVKGHLSPKETGLDVECSLERGLYCQSHLPDLPCIDFEISVLCRCIESITHGENVTTEIEPKECDITHPNSPHLTNCQLFYHCVFTSKRYELVEKSCGPGTLYNSETQVCDWPAEVVRIRPECSIPSGQTTQTSGMEWSTNYENTAKKIVSTMNICENGKIWSECAIQCTRVCQYYYHILMTQGHCNESTDCVAGCVSIDQPTCPSHKFWRDDITCVEANHCSCKSHDGNSVAPGAVRKESDCETCQCINNYYTCDTTFCYNVSSHEEAIGTGKGPEQMEIVTTQSSFGTISGSTWKILPITSSPLIEHTILIQSTVTPPEECDDANYIPLIRNLRNKVTIHVSSSKNPVLQSENLLIHTERNIPSSSEKFWEPEITNRDQWLEIEFDRPEPVYGMILQGAVTKNKFVTSYKVLFSEDGQSFSYMLDHEKQPRIFRGPADRIQSVMQKFYRPIEARIIRINPLTWHNGIAIKVDVLGCQDHITSMTTSTTMMTTITTMTTTTEQPIIKTTISEKIVKPVCEDSMGLNNGLMAIEQVTVSSLPQLIQNLSLSSKGVWHAALDNPHQYVQFDFLEARNLTGITTKGGDNTWTTVYKIFYSNDEHHWNPVIDENGNEKEFLGNFDSENQQTNFFDKPLHARLLRIQPVKWHNHVALKAEILGCYLPYPALKTSEIKLLTTTISSFERECNVCNGIEWTISDDEKHCKCEDLYWWNGESCVSKRECPCVIGHVSYPIGSVYETEDCQQCVCVLGGTSTCLPKKCEPCLEPGLRSVISKLCTCLCKPCPAGMRHCPTSDVCVNETSWCDGIQDCPDDENDCSEIISTTPIAIEVSETTSTINLQVTMTPSSINPCEEPFCPLGYRVVFKQSFRSQNKLHYNIKINNVKSKNGKSFAKGYKKDSFHELPMKNQDHQSAVEDIQCPEFICVPTKLPPVLPGNEKPEMCPETSCPPQYEVVFEKMSMYKKYKCPKYICRPLRPQEVICNVIGRTFNTFDNMEYKYDICNHILARDMYSNMWYIILKKLCLDSLGQHCTRILIVMLNERPIVLYPNLQVDIDGYTFTAEQIARFGNRFPGFELTRTGDRIIFLSHRYGFWVIWDSSINVKIGVVAKLAGRVDGLCGYFDGDIANDRQTPEGTQAKSTVQFGNSWAMEDAEECDLHVCPRDIQKQAWTICNSVRSPMLLDMCSAIVDLDRFVSRCVESVCSCLQSSNNSYEDCRCHLLTSFVGECKAAVDSGVNLLTDWRTIYDCPASCSSPFVHQDCFRNKCEITCDNLHEVEPCPLMRNICFPGCFCPDGLVRRNDDECVSPARCLDCVCDGFGDDKFIDFNRKNFRFTGNCTYLLSGNVVENAKNRRNGIHAYQILITNGFCSTGICTEVITLLYDEHVVQIRRAEQSKDLLILIDNFLVEKFPTNHTWIILDQMSTGDVILLVPFIQLEFVTFRKNFAFTLKLPSHIFSDVTEGLCGSCNANVEEGFEKRDGKLTQDVEEFGRSWLVEDLSMQLGLNDRTCSSNRQLQCMPPPADEDICKKLLDLPQFMQCHNIVDPKPYMDCCYDALCTDGNYCDSLEMYARKCLEAGLCPAWRTDEICPYECPKNLVYQPCGSSCKETCDTLKLNNLKCTSTSVEGCFCPKDYVFHNDSCILKQDCFVCDKDGHVQGDIWFSDKCTECNCNSGIISCQKTECPVLDTICEENMTPVLVNGTEEGCCAKYLCAPKSTASTICIESQEPECGFGQIMKAVIDIDGCHRFICQCPPVNECPTFDKLLNEIELQPGFVQVINTSGCCPRPTKICDPRICPSATNCPDYYNTTAIVLADSCCPTYECVAPKDICLYTNNEDQSVLAKQIGEKWKDGKCKTCLCENSYDGPKANCLITDCPSMNAHPDIEDYVLKEILLDDKCCPIFERTACKWKNKIYNVGENWKPNIKDACLSMYCDKGSGGIQILTKVQECNTECDNGYTYQVPNDTSVNCCGTCIQVACSVEGILKDVGEQWYSDDYCVTYFCESANGSVYIQANTETCPEIDPQLESEYEIEERKIPKKCCPEYIKTACRSDGQIYKPGEKWKSLADNCITETCVEPNITKRKEIEVCSTKCAPGWSYQESENDKCCGECKQTFCVFEDILYRPSSTWSSDDNCTTYTCMEKDRQLSLAISPVACPDITDCPPESIYYDQCCRRCNLTILNIEKHINETCKTILMDANNTIGMLVANHPLHGKCKNLDAIENIKECSGSCQSSTFFDSGSWNQVSNCYCCQAKEYIGIIVNLICEDGRRLKKQLTIPNSCSCQSCTFLDIKKEDRKIKSKG